MSGTMEYEHWQALLSTLASLPTDADSPDEKDLINGFLPLREHANALGPQILVVRGERGTGKTTLFRMLRFIKEQKLDTGAIFPQREQQRFHWVEGFSELGTAHPTTESLRAFSEQAQDDADLRLFWLGHLVGQLSQEGLCGEIPDFPLSAWLANRTRPSGWMTEAKTRLEELFHWLDQLDQIASQTDECIVITYDNLDRIMPDLAGNRERLVRALVSLWMSLFNRYRRLRCKVFLREDLYKQSLRGIPDASKLEERSVTLQWSTENLFRLLMRQMLAHDNLRDWLQGCMPTLDLKQRASLGWMPPDQLPEDGDVSRRSFVACFAPGVMGSGVNKGATHRWIPNHLQDAHAAIVPRSIVHLFKAAAGEALRANQMPTSGHLFTHLNLSAALISTSDRRSNELREEHRIVLRLNRLKGLQAPFDPKELQDMLGQFQDEGDGYGQDGQAVLQELENLGVLSRRKDGRVDIPDIYRFGLGVKRKGGVKKPK